MPEPRRTPPVGWVPAILTVEHDLIYDPPISIRVPTVQASPHGILISIEFRHGEREWSDSRAIVDGFTFTITLDGLPITIQARGAFTGGDAEHVTSVLGMRQSEYTAEWTIWVAPLPARDITVTLDHATFAGARKLTLQSSVLFAAAERARQIFDEPPQLEHNMVVS